MNLRPCKNCSSHIHSIGHDPETNTLAIKFHKGGATYHYPGVEASVFNEFHSHESPGSFFHTRIKSQYTAKKV